MLCDYKHENLFLLGLRNKEELRKEEEHLDLRPLRFKLCMNASDPLAGCSLASELLDLIGGFLSSVTTNWCKVKGVVTFMLDSVTVKINDYLLSSHFSSGERLPLAVI